MSAERQAPGLQTRRLQRLLLFGGAAGMLAVGPVAAFAIAVPLTRRLQNEQQNQLEYAVAMRTLTVSQLLGKFQGVAAQVSSRTRARNIRRCAHGHPDAGDGRLPGDCANP